MTSETHFQRLLGEATRRAIPLEVSLELTSRCNFRCRHCYLPDHRDRAPLPTPRFLALLDELAEMGTLFLTLTGGEPLLHSDWPAIGRHARRLGFKLAVLTNGSLVDEETAATLAELDAEVEVSLHASEPDVFDGVTRRRGSFAATTRGIQLLRRHGVPVLLKTTLMTENVSAMPGVTAFAERVGVSCRIYPNVFARRDGDGSVLAHRLGETDLIEHLRGPYAPSKPVSSAVPTDVDEWPMCAAGTRSAAITADGDVLACAILPRTAGSLLTQTFREIWEGSPLLQLLRRVRRSDLAVCSSCNRYAACGRCPAQALLEDGDLLGPSSAACAYAAALEKARAEQA